MADQNQQSKAHKPIHRTASSFDTPKISKLAPPHHDTVSGLLVHALTPIGEYRNSLPRPAKKSNKKRKRKAASTSPGNDFSHHVQTVSEPPSIHGQLLIGFNSVTRHLEDLSRHSRTDSAATDKDGKTKPAHVAAVFLLRPMDDLIYAHIPTLCHTASLAHTDFPTTRLILLDQPGEKEVVAAIGQARGVSILALVDDPGETESTKALLEYVREHIEPVNVPWLKQATEARWLGTKVDTQ